MPSNPEAAANAPDVVFDMLVVGGGPAGTAAAFRAKELGLRTLLIDFDDILKRIRDYPKDKLILPDFGGGDRMAFPAGDECVSALRFEPIDKDEICRRWRGLYATFGIDARTRIELTGVERDGDIWNVKTWDHKAAEAATFRARHVVLAIAFSGSATDFQGTLPLGYAFYLSLYSKGLATGVVFAGLKNYATAFTDPSFLKGIWPPGVKDQVRSTNVLPVGGPDQVAAAWANHLRLVRRSLERGFYQGWDLHPAQLPSRFAATYAFYREHLPGAARRLRDYLGQTGGAVLDEPATARALADLVVRALDCGAVRPAEAEAATGVATEQLMHLARPRRS